MSPPVQPGGILLWLRRNLFASVGSTLLTFAMIAFFATVIPPFWRWAVTGATLVGDSKAACSDAGACWTFIKIRMSGFFYGSYPVDQRWRINVAAVLFALFAVPALRERATRRWLWVLLFVFVLPVLCGVLLVGGVPGLPFVDTTMWGGLTVNVVLAFVAVAGSLPLGILLALGRRSEQRVVRWFCVGYIELWRGVPLLTVLFMGMVMLPIFLPEGVAPDRLVRAMVALTLFTAAYMAEVVRGGLQGVPSGQSEAAYSLGLGYWHVQALVVMPQALRLVLPGIVNTVIDLFKDTTLVTIVGLTDMLGTVNQAIRNPDWLGFSREGYAFAALTFFLCCYAMSLYSQSLEKRLNVHRRG